MKNAENFTNLRTANPSQFGDLLQSTAKALMQDASTYRKRVKPLYARFKAKISYADGNTRTMYSIDSCKQYSDNEREGLQVIKNWIIKCNDNGLINYLQIYVTLDQFKETSKMSYNYSILYWNSRLHDISNFNKCIIPELRFLESGKVNMDRLRNHFLI